MRHVYECPMRWADMDLLGHVNNVVYVDYLQEARVDMLRTHGPAATSAELTDGVVVVRHEVTYRAPLTFRFAPVRIECWVTEIRAASFTMAYEIFHEDPEVEGGRRVYLRATTLLTPYVFATERPRRLTDVERDTLAHFLEPEERRPRYSIDPARHEKVGHYPVHVRFSDVDVYGHVNNVKYFEYFQEARILLNARLWRDLDGPTPEVVVAQTDVDYKVPILFRPEPYDAWTWISRVGERSLTIDSEICDGDLVLSRCRVVLVFFDRETQGSTEPSPEHRAALEAALQPAPA
ncbi:acyl-CoA thioester hydrolase [Nocardioides ginsengisegetis]|uniref:Acyl-CoA thioester hydrolase n=1 Tax=Nocardioides ginsengisegetis TaxID=661491 RepID=A0A7W3PA79_9ACTN|nr:acyl-CoA thioester hydrolase [Nocardioides ginsengisegetis]